MSLVDVVREKQEALRVRDLAQLLGVSQQRIYKMAASGEIPSFKVANAVRFDPHETAEWLKEKYPVRSVEVRFPVARRAYQQSGT
jgi:excisionase family DNA binding protein